MNIGYNTITTQTYYEMLKPESSALVKEFYMTAVVGQANFLAGYCVSFIVYMKTNEEGSNINWESLADFGYSLPITQTFHGYPPLIYNHWGGQLLYIFMILSSWQTLTLCSLNIFTAIIGTLLLGRTADIFGRKITLLLVFVFYILAGIILFLWETNTAFFISRAFVGMGISGRLTIILYASEVCKKAHRGTIISVFNVSSMTGIITTYTLQYYFSISFVAGLLAVIASFSFCGMCFLPETKYWYAINDRMEEAKISSLWFDKSQSVEDVDKEVNEIRSPSTETGDQNVFQVILQPIHLKNFLIASLLYALRIFSGRAPLQIYPNNFFAQFQIPYNTEKLTILQSYLNLVIGIVSTMIIEKFNRRTLLLYISPVLSLLTVLLLFADIFGEFTCKIIPWVTPALICIYVGITSGFLFPLITVVAVEVVSISNKKRNAIFNITFVINFFLRGIFVFFFPSLLKYLTVDCVLVIFLMSNVLLFALIKFFVHETSNTALHSSAKVANRRLDDELRKSLLNSSDSDSEYDFLEK